MKESDDHYLSSMLTELGWDAVHLSKEEKQSGLAGVFEHQFATLGVIQAQSAKEVETSWGRAQSALSVRKAQDPVGRWKDHYLLILVDKADKQDWDLLSKIANDTHVCRKICEVIEGQPLKKILRRSPVINLKAESQSRSEWIPSDEDLDSNLVPRALLDDLAKRSAKTILERLLEGYYEKEV